MGDHDGELAWCYAPVLQRRLIWLCCSLSGLWPCNVEQLCLVHLSIINIIHHHIRVIHHNVFRFPIVGIPVSKPWRAKECKTGQTYPQKANTSNDATDQADMVVSMVRMKVRMVVNTVMVADNDDPFRFRRSSHFQLRHHK